MNDGAGARGRSVRHATDRRSRRHQSEGLGGNVGDPVTNVAAAGISETRTGWTAGGGVEWAFARNWSVKAEYLYADFGSVSFVSAFNVDPDFTYTHTVHPTAQIVRAGVNYKFDWMGR